MSRLLLIDAGNTRTKWAVTTPHAKIQVRGTIATADLNAASLKRIAAKFPAHRAILSCVVPRLVPEFQHAFGRRLQTLTGKSPELPISFALRNPAKLGADRIAAAVAAHADGTWPAIIISCGTATAISVLNARGQFAGGIIAPGLQAQLDALVGATAQLPRTTIRAPRKLPARSTRDAIRAGVLLSFQGGVREMVLRLRESLPGSATPRILLTGGDAAHLERVFGRQAELRPLLVFEGLRIMGARFLFASVS